MTLIITLLACFLLVFLGLVMWRVLNEKSHDRQWECTCCGTYTTLWSYEDLASRGSPVCPLCDEEMSLINIETK